MQIFNTSFKGTDYFQIYLTKEELENKQIQEKIHKIKDSNAKVAVFERCPVQKQQRANRPEKEGGST